MGWAAAGGLPRGLGVPCLLTLQPAAPPFLRALQEQRRLGSGGSTVQRAPAAAGGKGARDRNPFERKEGSPFEAQQGSDDGSTDWEAEWKKAE